MYRTLEINGVRINNLPVRLEIQQLLTKELGLMVHMPYSLRIADTGDELHKRPIAYGMLLPCGEVGMDILFKIHIWLLDLPSVDLRQPSLSIFRLIRISSLCLVDTFGKHLAERIEAFLESKETMYFAERMQYWIHFSIIEKKGKR